MKTQQQNKTFWALIDCFWQSGCSSFLTYNDMLFYYYRIAGLVELVKKEELEKKTKKMLFKAINLLPIEETERAKVFSLLSGKYEKCLSWSMVEKEKALLAIDSLIKDMDESNVFGSKMGNKYREILKGMGEAVDDLGITS
jgi:hypothetical protein